MTFPSAECFDNGTPIVPILKECYRSADPQLRMKWFRALTSTGFGSFFSWLNAPAEISAVEHYTDLPITHLAAFLHLQRADLRAAFPDPGSQDRVRFIEWFLNHGRAEYDLDPVFLEGTSLAWRRWSSAQALAKSLAEAEGRIAAVYTAAERYSEVFDCTLDVYRGQRAWKLMLAVRRAYAMVVRYGWKGRIRLLLGPRPPIGNYELSFPSLKNYLPPRPESGPSEGISTLSTNQPPPSRYDVIVLAIIDFGFRFQRPQQIASEFARRGHRVFWVTATEVLPPNSPKPYRVVPLREGIWEVRVRAPQCDPYLAILTDATVREFQAGLDLLYRDWAIAETAIVVQLPFWRRLALSLRREASSVIVYDCMDDWDTFENLGDFNRTEEAQLAAECDVLVVTAGKLKQKFADRGLAPVLVRNGADFEFFRSAEPLPELSGRRRPVIGYFGAIADWIDLDLVYDVAKSRPDYSFILVGQVFGRDTSALESLRNVWLLGSRPYEQMAQLLAGFDVCIIPFLLNQVTHATDPVKLYEYLSQGKPVVATDMGELRACADLLYLARGSEQFAAKLDAAVAESDAALRERRIDFARTNSWPTRVSVLDMAIRECFPKVSVLIVTHNSAEFLGPCLRALSVDTSYPAMEVIVIDNASTDESAGIAEQFKAEDDRISVVRMASNTGFAGGNNAAARFASGEFLVFLNADAMVTPGWLAYLLRHLDLDPSIGLICPVTNFAGNEAKINVEYTDERSMRSFALRIASENRGSVIDMRVAPLFCALIRRDLFQDLGGLDEGYRIGMFEDDDLAEAVRKRGFRVCAADDCFVHHFGQGSFSKLAQEEYDRIFEANRRHFEQKWNTTWIRHQTRPNVRPAYEEARFTPAKFCEAPLKNTPTARQPPSW
jgi:GT2 family glycosyltransferase/glycosyltransferase involved in cell wall biosynthesis